MVVGVARWRSVLADVSLLPGGNFGVLVELETESGGGGVFGMLRGGVSILGEGIEAVEGSDGMAWVSFDAGVNKLTPVQAVLEGGVVYLVGFFGFLRLGRRADREFVDADVTILYCVLPCILGGAENGLDVRVVSVDVEASRVSGRKSGFFITERVEVNSTVFVEFTTNSTFPSHFMDDFLNTLPVKFVFVDLRVCQEYIFVAEEVVVLSFGRTVTSLPRPLGRPCRPNCGAMIIASGTGSDF